MCGPEHQRTVLQRKFGQWLANIAVARGDHSERNRLASTNVLSISTAIRLAPVLARVVADEQRDSSDGDSGRLFIPDHASAESA